MKIENKTKTDCLGSLSVFVLIVIKLGPVKKSFHKLGLNVSSGFPNTRNNKIRPRAFISFLVFGNPYETLALIYEILLERLDSKLFIDECGS